MKKSSALGCLALIALPALGLFAISQTPSFKRIQAETAAKREAELVEKERTAKAEENAAATKKQANIASGQHCMSGWDGSFPALKDAVETQLRDPDSFEHVVTNRSPVGKDGKFGVIMTYRAANGFGGLNVEVIGVEVDAKTCAFERASTTALARRLKAAS